MLDAAWIGASSLPSRTLYPHQWSSESAFMALGRSWYDQARAQQELETLFRAQWSNGMVPHIVFNPSVAEDAYFPGPAFWQSSTRSPHAPRDVETSGITQPTIHAHAALEMHRHALDPVASAAFLRWLYPRLVAQHRYMLDARRPAGTRLAVMVHPWESGLDNSPAWDRALDELVIPPGGVPPYVRRDLAHGDPKDRPTNEAYDRFVYLAARYRDSGYDDARLVDVAPFLIAGPMFDGILACRCRPSRRSHPSSARTRRHTSRTRRKSMPRSSTSSGTLGRGRMSALEVTRGERSVEDTIVSFAPLLDPHLSTDVVDAIVAGPAIGELPSRPAGRLSSSRAST